MAVRRASALIGSPEPIAALNRIRILEYAHPWPAREPLVDVRTYCPLVVVSEHLCPYLRRKVADMVNTAAASLPHGYRLRMGSAMRTLAMQKGGWDSYHRKLRQEHPEWPLSSLRRATNKYFAPYDQKAPPGHCTGGATDVGLLDRDGKEIDLIFPTTGWEAAYTWSDKLSPETKANRMHMVEAMLAAGFSNCRDEFWHYSYGDSAWAVRSGEKECPYGWTYPPVALESNYPEASAADLRIDFERDRNGRILSAEGECAVLIEGARTAEGNPFFSVGLYWASGVPVTLHVRLPASTLASFCVFVGAQRDKPDGWHSPLQCERRGDSLFIRLTPESDRLYVATTIPLAPENKKETDLRETREPEENLEDKALEDDPAPGV